MMNPPAGRVAILRTWPDIHAFNAFFAQYAWHPGADLATLEAAGPPPVCLLYLADAPRAALIAQLKGRFIDVDYGFTYGALDGGAADALVSSIEQLLVSTGAHWARFGYIPESSPLHRRLTGIPWLWRDRFPHANDRYSLDLPDSYDALLAAHSKTTRKKLRNALNRLSRAHSVEFRCLTSPAAFLDDVSRIDLASYQHRIGAGLDPAVARLPGLRTYLLYLDERPAAFYLGSLYRGVFWGLYTGFDPAFRDARPGTVLFQFVLEDLCNGQLAHAIDFGLGDSGYKEVFASARAPYVEVFLFRRSIPTLPYLAARLARGAARRLVYAALGRLGLVQRLKTLYRQRHT